MIPLFVGELKNLADLLRGNGSLLVIDVSEIFQIVVERGMGRKNKETLPPLLQWRLGVSGDNLLSGVDRGLRWTEW